MAKKRTGLRNRYRSGRSTYSVQHKSRQADIYGKMTNGKIDSQDVIAGRTCSPLRNPLDRPDTRDTKPVERQIKEVFHQSKV